MTTTTCPKCSHTYTTGSRRICYKCKKPITRRHKWVIENSKIRHRLCDDPTHYVPEKDRRKK